VEHDLILLLGLGLALIHLLGVLSAVHAVAGVRTPQGAIAWAVSLLTFPYLALPLYWVFGRDRFHGYIDARRAAVEAIREQASGGLAQRLAALRAGPLDAWGGEPAADLEVLARIAEMPFTRGNRLQLLIDGEATFAAIFAAVESAQRYCLIQSFIVKDDGLGRRLQALLLRRAGEGVRCYLLYDEVGSHGLPRPYVETLRAAGVMVSAFHTTRGRRNRFQLNFRNHRKVVVVDGHTAFVGGHNVGDEYLGLGPLGHWRDTHLRIEGPAALALQQVFVADWYWATRIALALDWEPPSDAASGTGAAVLVYPTGPADTLDRCSMYFHAACAAARRRLWIASPYFVPDGPVFAALQLAALRGVDVRVLLPARPDHLLVWLASFSFLPTAERTGIRVFRYQDGFLHQKVVLIDDAVAAIGSANLDTRSLRLNFEITAVTADPALAGQVAAMLEADFGRARPAVAADLRDRGPAFRWAVRAARLLDPIL
jgi:cardiolipin synthase A/B